MTVNTTERTYGDVTYWQRYEAQLPAEFRLTTEHPEEERWLWGDTSVHVDRLPAPNAPLKLLLVHGIGGYGRIVLGFGAPFRPQLCEVVAPDLPGYGLTPVTKEPLVFSTWVSCVTDLVDRELRRDNRPVVLFGLSLGGIVAYHAACTAPIRGLLATALIDMTDPEVAAGVSRYQLVSRFTLPLLRRIPSRFDETRIPVRHLGRIHAISNDAELSRLVAGDPCGGRTNLPLSFLKSIMTTAPAVAPEAFRRCPVLLVHPGADQMTQITFSRRFFDRLAAPKRLAILDQAGHWPIEEPGATQMRKEVRTFLENLERVA